MLILDTDHASLIQRGGAEGIRIRERMIEHAGEDLCITVVSYEEQLPGRMAEIRRTHTLNQQPEPYKRLLETLELYCAIRVMPFDDRAVTEYQKLWLSRIRIGPMDMKISAIALVYDATLLSRNLRDSHRVPNLRCEDWSH